MKKFLAASAFAMICLSTSTIAFADSNEKTKDSKYCMSNGSDPLCMGPEMLAQRTKMMEMTKDKAMESRTAYCRDHADEKDPICDPKMMSDTTGY